MNSRNYWQSGSIFGITSPEAFPFVPLKNGVIFQDFYVPYLEWQKIRLADLWIASWNHPLVLGHISLRNEDLSIDGKKTIAAEIDAYEKLKGELNAEFFFRLAALLDQEGLAYLKRLPLESTEKYTLEGMLRTVHQEITSPLLKRRLEQIKEAKLALVRGEDPFLHEKDLVRERQAIGENLTTLEEITSQIGNELPGFAAFEELIGSGSFEKRERALGRLVKEFDLQLVLIGDLKDKQVQSALELLTAEPRGSQR